MPAMSRVAEFELRILLTVSGVATTRMRSRSLGAVYITLDRLVRKGWLQSRLGEPSAARGGRAKRYYTNDTPRSHPPGRRMRHDAASVGRARPGARAMTRTR